MPRGSDLTVDENERVRTAIRELVRRFGDQVKLAPKLGVHQSTLSGILGGRQGASYHLAVSVARLMGTEPRDLLAGDHGRAVDKRALAAELAREDGVMEGAIQDVLDLPPEPDRSTLSWALAMKRREAELLDRSAGAAPKRTKPV